MDDIRTAAVTMSMTRAAHVNVADLHASASMSNPSTFVGYSAIEASKPATKRDGSTPTRNWHPARRPPGTT